MKVLSHPTAALAALVTLGSVAAGSAGLLAPASAATAASSGSSLQASVSSVSSVSSSVKQRHLGPDPAWFVDQVSPAHRATEIKVPRRPARFRGQPLRYTRALQRTRASHLAVPARLAYGHELLAGQALSFDAGSLFLPRSARLTPHAARVVVRLAYSMAHVTSATCEGYMDYGRAPVVATSGLSTARAASLCHALAGQTGGLSTTQVGYGSSRPAVVGATADKRAANRRVVLVIKANAVVPSLASAPTISHVSTSQSDGPDWTFTPTWTTPDSDGGHPITGYEWSLDGGTTWTALTSTASGTDNTGTFHTGLALCSSGTKALTIRAVTSAGGGSASAAFAVTYVDGYC